MDLVIEAEMSVDDVAEKVMALTQDFSDKALKEAAKKDVVEESASAPPVKSTKVCDIL